MKKSNNRSVIKKILSAALCCCLLFGFPVQAAAEVDLYATYAVDSDYWDYWPQAGGITGVTGVLMDADTGTILYSKGLDAPRYPASITKVMTALIVLENCSLDEQVVMTETGLADAYSGSSNIIPTLGEVFTVEQCLQMLLVKSANDVATQLAEHTAGSVEAFADMMNAKAASLGCMNTHFANASGLENENHYTSARDMALIMRAAIQNPVFTGILSMQSIEIPPTNCSNARYYDTHVMLIQPGSEYYYPGCLGGKTGYTDISASTLVCYAQRDGMTLIGVVMGAPETGRNAIDMITLFDYGFANFHRENAVYDVPCISGGTVTLPNGISSDVMHYSAVDQGETVDVNFTIADHRIGSCSMTRDSFDALYGILGDAIEGAPVQQTAQEAPEQDQNPAEASVSDETEQAVSADTDPAETTSAEEKTQSPRQGKTVFYVIIVILGAAILVCLLFLSMRAKEIRKRKKKKTNNKKRSNGGKK